MFKKYIIIIIYQSPCNDGNTNNYNNRKIRLYDSVNM